MLSVTPPLIDPGRRSQRHGGFPKSVCTSVNECMCHGIPDSRQLQSGDIINIDVTVYLDGYHGDTSRTFFCGEVTEECLEKGIAVCKDGASFKKIGKRISEHAEKYGYNVVERFVGHGVGPVFHSEPLIYHYRKLYILPWVQDVLLFLQGRTKYQVSETIQDNRNFSCIVKTSGCLHCGCKRLGWN